MLFRLRRRRPGVGDREETTRFLADCEKRYHTYAQTIRALFGFLKDFAMDGRDIDGEGFRRTIDQLTDKFFEQNRAKHIQKCFDRHQPVIGAYIENQRTYIEARDRELRQIIDLLTRATTAIHSANDAYHQEILLNGERIEQITRLDDIRNIKSSLAKEVASLRETVHVKQADEKFRIESLASQVDTLREELQMAQAESQRDGLTGVYNRRAFDRHIQHLLDQRRVKGAAFALLILDIDDFKRVNDTHGHPVGDRVILALANACRQMIRRDDFLARYGGEEFVILLPGASRRNAAKKARQICRSVAQTHYTLAAEKNEPTLSITVSIGVSDYRRGDNVESLLQRADKALYDAKAAGKNRVAIR